MYGYEWKAVFMMLEGLFKPIVMFFRLTDSPATFQMMMNEILQNLINTGEVTSFIDYVIVGTEEEERYDKIVEEIVRRLAENNLYVKLEKYKWKVKEVRFLGVVVTNFIQLVSPQPVDRFSQTKLFWKAPNEGYLQICGMYKSNNKKPRYHVISNCKIFVC